MLLKPKKDKVRAVHKPVANAIGAGLEVMTANGIMVVDIGAETTEIAVMALGGIVNSKKVNIGGTRLDDTIINCLKKIALLDSVLVVPPSLPNAEVDEIIGLFINSIMVILPVLS